MATWYRICLDLDTTGGPIGGSWEIHHDDDPKRIQVFGINHFSPFDDQADAFAEVLLDCAKQVGFQMSLF